MYEQKRVGIPELKQGSYALTLGRGGKGAKHTGGETPLAVAQGEGWGLDRKGL